eukprot:7674538-Pyramimonas_sp.AAC.1
MRKIRHAKRNSRSPPARLAPVAPCGRGAASPTYVSSNGPLRSDRLAPDLVEAAAPPAHGEVKPAARPSLPGPTRASACFPWRRSTALQCPLGRRPASGPP